jgi:phospholipase/carboxylesterase
MAELGTIDLRIRPAAGTPEGALVLNHGRAADEHDLFTLLDELDPERRLIGMTTGAPLRGLPPGGRHWYVVERVGYPDPQTFHRSYSMLAECLDASLAEHGIDWGRTAIGGFSQGTVMSYAVALGEGRPTPAAIVAFSGFIPTVQGWAPDLAGRGGLRAFVHHGRRDPVISVEFGRAAERTLREGAVEVDYRETEAGHWLPPEMLGPARELLASALPSGDRTRT